jgi:hypothetical protein
MLMKPRRWLAYTIQLNDLLEPYEEIVDRFAASDIPLDATFGSNTVAGAELPGLLLAIGPAVEPARLAEIVALLDGLGQLFVLIDLDGPHDKSVCIGALNLGGEPVAAVAGPILATLRTPGASALDLVRAVATAPKVHVLSGRDAADEW